MKTEIKKLLLTSDGFVNPKIAQEFLVLVDKNPADIKVLFIPTAAEHKFQNKEEMFYVKESEKELIAELGIKKEHIIWFDIDSIAAAGNLNNYDVMYVCGGNTFYLMHKFRVTGFDKKIIEFVNSGRVYVGVSAGSIIMGPQITTSSDKNMIELKDVSGLNLFNQCIVPHYQKKEKSVIDDFEKKNNYEVVRLNDGQAVEAIGDDYKIIE